METVDLVGRGRVLTMDRERRIIEGGAVAVRDGRILAIGKAAEIDRRFTAKRCLGGADGLILPGFIDGHTHCTQCFVRGLTSGELPMIPRIYSAGQKAVTPEDAASSVRMLCAQLLRSGVTTVCEGTLNPAHEPALIDTFKDIGMRCVLARGASDQEYYHASLYSQYTETSWLRVQEGRAEADLAHSEDLLNRYPPRGDGLIHAAVNASSLLGFSERYFTEGAALARKHDASFHVHVARDREEVEFCTSIWGRRPVERLSDMGVLDERLVAAHAVLASEREIELMARAGAALAHSPIECVANLNAIPNLPRFRAAGIRVALGCDNQANDMFANMRAAWLIHGSKWGIGAYDPEFLPASDVLAMATIEAAEVLRIDRVTGSLEAGKAADLIVLDGSAPHLMSAQDIESELVRYASRAEILQTVVAGRVLYDEGRYSTIDLNALARGVPGIAAKVRAAANPRRYRPYGE